MKKLLKLILLFVALLFAHNATAYDPGTVEELCKKPKFTNFSLNEYKPAEKQEVAPEADFSFAISNWIDPSSIKLQAKNKALPFTVEDKNSFFLVHAKMPTEYTGQFVRLNVMADARLGCRGLHGWLVKVAAQ